MPTAPKDHRQPPPTQTFSPKLSVADTKPAGTEKHRRTRHQEGSRRGNVPSDGQTFSTVAEEHCITESPATQHLDRRNADLYNPCLTHSLQGEKP